MLLMMSFVGIKLKKGTEVLRSSFVIGDVLALLFNKVDFVCLVHPSRVLEYVECNWQDTTILRTALVYCGSI